MLWLLVIVKLGLPVGEVAQNDVVTHLFEDRNLCLYVRNMTVQKVYNEGGILTQGNCYAVISRENAEREINADAKR